jgi:hypothetical protein
MDLPRMHRGVCAFRGVAGGESIEIKLCFDLACRHGFSALPPGVISKPEQPDLGKELDMSASLLGVAVFVLWRSHWLRCYVCRFIGVCTVVSVVLPFGLSEYISRGHGTQTRRHAYSKLIFR